MAAVEDCVSINDFELLAKKKVPNSLLIFANSGSMDEQTFQENVCAFKEFHFKPRVLRDLSSINLSTSVLGKTIKFPVGVAPTGLMKMFSIRGELDAANAACNLGTVFTLSNWASTSIEEIGSETVNGMKFFQLYPLKDRELTKNLVKRAENNGFTAIVLTVDCSVTGKRCKIIKEFKSPLKVPIANLESEIKPEDLGSLHDATMTWKDFGWLKSITSLPIIVKGILTGDGALEVVQHGADGVWVSNHGGRQLDGALPSIYALPVIAKAVNGRCQIFFDGGIRNGSDVAKAIALGADAVFIGRPVIWGVASGGASGAQKVLEIMRDELELTMKLLGVTSVEELRSSPDIIVHRSNLISKL